MKSTLTPRNSCAVASIFHLYKVNWTTKNRIFWYIQTGPLYLPRTTENDAIYSQVMHKIRNSPVNLMRKQNIHQFSYLTLCSHSNYLLGETAKEQWWTNFKFFHPLTGWQVGYKQQKMKLQEEERKVRMWIQSNPICIRLISHSNSWMYYMIPKLKPKLLSKWKLWNTWNKMRIHEIGSCALC